MGRVPRKSLIPRAHSWPLPCERSGHKERSIKNLKVGAVALAGVFLFASSASALQTSQIRRGGTTAQTMERQQELDDKRALRERIRATHEEYRALRNAGDPRAEQVGRDLQSLKSEWTRRYGNDTEMRKRGEGKKHGHHKEMKQKRQKHQR